MIVLIFHRYQINLLLIVNDDLYMDFFRVDYSSIRFEDKFQESLSNLILKRFNDTDIEIEDLSLSEFTTIDIRNAANFGDDDLLDLGPDAVVPVQLGHAEPHPRDADVEQREEQGGDEQEERA